MNPIFRATVQKGKVVFHNVDLFNGFLISLEGKDVDVTVKKKKKTRSNPQNAFYWGVVIKLLCETTGYNDDEMHNALKMLFLQDRSRKIPTLRSTTTLSTMEFEDYLEKIRIWASTELSCNIPLPNEVDFEENKPVSEPTPREIKKHQAQKKIDTRENKIKQVSSKTLEEILGWVGKGNITKEKIIELSKANFNGRIPDELTQEEAETLDTLIVSELPI